MYNISKMCGWSIYILWRDCEQESESDNIAKCVYLDIFICSKASASAENKVASSGSRVENTFLSITAATATFFTFVPLM